MASDIQRQINRNDTASLPSAIALNSSTSTTISTSNNSRTFFAISNTSGNDLWLKLQAASVDNDKKGIFIAKKSYWEMITDNIYTGEISAISTAGTPSVNITEY